jgi:curli biogenesis system outer membrane secretion channel CsgG
MRRRGKLHIITLAALLCLLTAPAPWAAELKEGAKDTILIGRLKIQPSVIEQAKRQGRELELKSVAESLDTQFINALSATRIFQIVERKRKADIELEQAFAQGGGVDLSDKDAAQAGKMAGAKFAFLPQIDGFEDRSETEEYQQIGRQSITRKLFISAIVQVVDTTTGKLLPDAPSVQMTKTDTAEMTRTGAGMGTQQVMVALAKETAQRLCQDVVSLLRPARVLDVMGKQVMINRGTEAGFNKDSLVEFYATRDVKDDETGETFRSEAPVGQARIVRADKKQSYAILGGDDLGVAKGCIAKVITDTPKIGAAVPGVVPVSTDTQTPGSSDKPLKWNK